ncbi:DUF6963 family protein [Amorphus sp. MBR-141]
MTVGLVCAGPNAGLAAFRALAAIERVATGSIGGFVAFAAIDATGRVHEAATQRGGSATLFIAGETTGAPPPDPVAAAPLAGLISSGPERPEPLSRFMAVDAAAGIVAGHRLPNAPGADGRPHNIAVLDALRGGAGPEAAVRAVLKANPEADVGLIVADRAGRLSAANTRRVAARPDLGYARLDRPDAGASVVVMHNAIGPGPSIAALAAEVAMAVMVPSRPDAAFSVAAGTPVVLGDQARVEIDAVGRAVQIFTTDPVLTAGRANGAAIYLGAEVCRDGHLLGRVADEPNCIIEHGRLISMSGQTLLDVSYRTIAPNRTA